MRQRVEMVHDVTGERLTRYADVLADGRVRIYAAPTCDTGGTLCTREGRTVLRGLPGAEHWRLAPESYAELHEVTP